MTTELDIEKQNAGNSSLRLMAAKARVQGLEYSCFLDEHLDAKLATHYLSDVGLSTCDVELTVNPSFRLQSGSAFPEDVRHLAVPARGFLKHYPIAWVADAGTRVWMPYWARGEWADLLAQLRPGAPAPAGLSPTVRRTLLLAGILLPPDYEQQREHWTQVCNEARATFLPQATPSSADSYRPCM